MVLAAVRLKAVVLLLLTYCLLPIVCWVLCLVLVFLMQYLGVFSSFAIILLRKRELVILF